MTHPDRHPGRPEYVQISQTVGYAIDVLLDDDGGENARVLQRLLRTEATAWKRYNVHVGNATGGAPCSLRYGKCGWNAQGR